MKINQKKHNKEKLRELKTSKVINKLTSVDNSNQSSRNSPVKKELGGFEGPEPTRFGDWEHNGRCTDF